MHPQLKALYSSEVDLSSWTPRSLSDVYLLIDLEIGEGGTDAQDLFYLTVATPEGLRAHARGTVIASRATLVLSEYSLTAIREQVSRIVSSCEAPTWSACCEKLQRHFRWEYEDYVMDTQDA